MVLKLDDSCSLEQNSDKLLIRGMEPAEQSKPSETLLPANYHCHCHWYIVSELFFEKFHIFIASEFYVK